MPRKSKDSSNGKTPTNEWIRGQDFDEIDRILDEMVKSSTDPDLLHPLKRGLLALLVTKELAKTKLIYAKILQLKDPNEHSLFRSLQKHITEVWMN